MTVRYSLSRGEVASGYLYGWKHSPTFRLQMLVIAAFVAAMQVGSTYLQHHALSRSDVVTGGLWALAALLGMPILLALTAKTQERVLELAPDGIRTTIGQRNATLPWSAISFVCDADSFVMIGRKNSNAFFVPNRAFVDDQARKEFVANGQEWQRRAG